MDTMNPNLKDQLASEFKERPVGRLGQAPQLERWRRSGLEMLLSRDRLPALELGISRGGGDVSGIDPTKKPVMDTTEREFEESIRVDLRPFAV